VFDNNLTRITGTLHEYVCIVMLTSHWIILTMTNVYTKLVEKIETHFMFNNVFSENRCSLWDNVEKYGRIIQDTDDNIIRRMHIAWWITKATNTYPEQLILIAFPLPQWLHERASLLRCTHSASFLWLIIRGKVSALCSPAVFHR
jgi:hypothetical protein